MNKRLLASLSAAFFISLIVLSVFLSLKKRHVKQESFSRVAIVIDDWGYNMDNVKLLNSIDIPLTLAVLPNLAFSGRIDSIESRRADREVILHMPMEPENASLRLEKDTILTSMEDKRIGGIISAALKTVPSARGVSSHMGSKATQDKRVIDAVMKQLKSEGLFFLDSVASPDTVCRQSAADYGVAFAERDVFLDNVADKEYISLQIDELIETARKKGSAVGIGHDKALTLKAIKEKSLKLKDSDIEFVPVSELVEK